MCCFMRYCEIPACTFSVSGLSGPVFCGRNTGLRRQAAAASNCTGPSAWDRGRAGRRPPCSAARKNSCAEMRNTRSLPASCSTACGIPAPLASRLKGTKGSFHIIKTAARRIHRCEAGCSFIYSSSLKNFFIPSYLLWEDRFFLKAQHISNHRCKQRSLSQSQCSWQRSCSGRSAVPKRWSSPSHRLCAQQTSNHTADSTTGHHAVHGLFTGQVDAVDCGVP